MNKVLLDSNALIAAFDRSHADHRRALAFVEGLEQFFTSPQTQGAFLRFFTRPWTDTTGQRREPRMTTGRAMSHLKAILTLPKHRFLADDLSFDRISMRSLSGFKQWNDAYLMALATKHRAKLATLERKLENMDSSESPVILVLPWGLEKSNRPSLLFRRWLGSGKRQQA
jgi:predicted nucleic acid-binding protein